MTAAKTGSLEASAVWDRRPQRIEITETRTDDWIVEAPCGFFINLGPGVGYPAASEVASYHRRHCQHCRHAKRQFGREVNEDTRNERRRTA